MDDARREDKAGSALEEVLGLQAGERRREPVAPSWGPKGSRARANFTSFICGTAWIGALLMPLRFGDGLTWLYTMRMTLVVAAVAIPMLLVEDRTLWASKRRRLTGALGGASFLAWVVAGLLYLLAFAALFAFMDLFW